MTGPERDSFFMQLALDQARAAAELGETPVGAVLVAADGEILAAAGNGPIRLHDPTAHAEILALRAGAAATGNNSLPPGTRRDGTRDPCAMCAGGISHARDSRLVYAAADPKGGAVAHGPQFFASPTCHWRPEVVDGPHGDTASLLLKQLFHARLQKGQP